MERTNVYVDGFNFYYGCLKGTPHRWLDLGAYFRTVFPHNHIHRIRYFTALAKSWDDPGQPQRQLTYLRALRTMANLTIHDGHYAVHKKWRRLVHPPVLPAPQAARVWIAEEKGSDVNLASHLLMDGFDRDYEVAIVVSNDSDLVEPIRLVRQRLGLKVGILNPHQHPARDLLRLADFYQQVRQGPLAACHFPDEMDDGNGHFFKPVAW